MLGGSPGSGDPPEPEELISALQELEENSASSDAVVREKIAKLPAEVSEVSKLESLKSVAEVQLLQGKYWTLTGDWLIECNTKLSLVDTYHNFG